MKNNASTSYAYMGIFFLVALGATIILLKAISAAEVEMTALNIAAAVGAL